MSDKLITNNFNAPICGCRLFMVGFPFHFSISQVRLPSCKVDTEFIPMDENEDMDGVLVRGFCFSKRWYHLYTLLFWKPFRSHRLFLFFISCISFSQIVYWASNSFLKSSKLFHDRLLINLFLASLVSVYKNSKLFLFRPISNSIMDLEQMLHVSSYFVQNNESLFCTRKNLDT